MRLKLLFASSFFALWVVSNVAFAAQAAKPGFDEKAVANFYQGKTIRVMASPATSPIPRARPAQVDPNVALVALTEMPTRVATAPIITRHD